MVEFDISYTTKLMRMTYFKRGLVGETTSNRSTFIFSEFLEYHPGRDYLRSDDCILACPKGPANEEEPACQSSKCCQPNEVNGARHQSSSAQNTPLSARKQKLRAQSEVRRSSMRL